MKAVEETTTVISAVLLTVELGIGGKRWGGFLAAEVMGTGFPELRTDTTGYLGLWIATTRVLGFATRERQRETRTRPALNDLQSGGMS